MKNKGIILLVALFAIFINIGYSNELLNNRNLEGLKKINKTIHVYINVSGDDPFNLRETRIKELIQSKFRKLNIQIDEDNKANATIHIAVTGESTGGGGASFTVELFIISRVQSPFSKDKKIPSIVWTATKQEDQAMSYDPEKKKLIKVKGDLDERTYIVIQELMSKFEFDYKKANM